MLPVLCNLHFSCHCYFLLDVESGGSDVDKKSEKGKNLHIMYDLFSLIETATLTGLGVYYMVDANFDKLYFIIIMSMIQAFGMLAKAWIFSWNMLTNNTIYWKITKPKITQA